VNLLIVTAVAAERDAIGTPGRCEVIVGGVGPAAAAASASAALARGQYDLVISAGIGGGFAPRQPGELVVADAVVFADLGAESPGGFLPVSALGFGSERYTVDAAVARELASRTGAATGTVLTVATVTGTAERADELRRAHPDAAAEAMEGAGVAAAARLLGVPFGELRAISNVVGPRDRDAWRIGDALTALTRAVADITAAPWTAT